MQPHPAPFSDVIVRRLRELLQGEGKVRALDPFAGVGRALFALQPGSTATMIEIEACFVQEGLDALGIVPALDDFYDGVIRFDYESVDTRYVIADSREFLKRDRRSYTHIVTSPTYGNRFTDGYRSKPGTKCRSYAQSKGAALEDGNTGSMKFGSGEYDKINREVMEISVERLKVGGKCIVNVSDFYKTLTRGEHPTRMPVVRWWTELLFSLGLSCIAIEPIQTRRFKEGENRHRVTHESILIFEKGEFYDGPSTRSALRRSRG